MKVRGEVLRPHSEKYVVLLICVSKCTLFCVCSEGEMGYVLFVHACNIEGSNYNVY